MKQPCLFSLATSCCILFCISLSAQLIEECDFELPSNGRVGQELIYVSQVKDWVESHPEGLPPIVIPLNITVLRQDDGTEGNSGNPSTPVTQLLVDEMIANLNVAYDPANIEFVQCGNTHYIDNTRIRELDSPYFYFTYNTSTLNIVIGINNGGPLGSSSFMSLSPLANNTKNRFWIRTGDFLLKPTTPHELAHTLNLYHTFNGAGFYNDPLNPLINDPMIYEDYPGNPGQLEREMVVRTTEPGLNYQPNFDVGGDYIEDTPASCTSGSSEFPSPNDSDCLSYPEINSCAVGCTYDPVACLYTGDYVDYNGHPLEDSDVMIRNFMSYTGDCRTEFTQGQNERMSMFANLFSDHYNFSDFICPNLIDQVQFEDTEYCIPGVTISITNPSGDGSFCRVTSDAAGNFEGTLYGEVVNTKLNKIGRGDENGNYDPNELESYQIFEYLSWEWQQGVSTLDAAILYSHILGINPLNGYNKIAADVNNSGSLTALDIIEIQKLVTFQQESFTEIKQGIMRFVPEYIPAFYGWSFHQDPFNMVIDGQQYSNVAPYLFGEWEYTISNGLNNLSGFDAVKMGDVNGSLSLPQYLGQFKSNS